MKNEMQRLSEIVPYEQHPRVIDQVGVAVARSIVAVCIPMELNPVYCDVIVQRFERFSGQQAERPSAATTCRVSTARRDRSHAQ